QFEEQLRSQKEYFESLFVNSPAAVMTIDQDARIVSWNPMAQKLLGYTQEEAIGQHIDDLVARDSLIRQEAVGYTQEILSKDRVQATTRRTRKDGSLVEVEILGLPVVVAGKKLGYIVIYHDISELQKARRAAESASQAKSTFLANMSHELRTPLNAILGFAQLMVDDPNLTGEQRQALGLINHSGEHLLSLINDVLEMSKIEAGRVTLKERNADLWGLLHGLEEMFRLPAEEKGLALSFQQAHDVPRSVVTDEGKLRQVLSNLLSNAVKFTQRGSVTLRVSLLPQLPAETAKQTLHFEVEDTGPGMTAEELAAVFKPFVQAAIGQQSHEGTGLGLSISESFVRLMGGHITVESHPRQGSLFQFDVQVGQVDAAQVQPGTPGQKVLGLAPGQPTYRLLVAEDREANRRLLVQLLTRLGFEVREAVNGQQALHIWEDWKPHLIWMDMRMPVLDGYQATRQIKATPAGQATVIIALTASAFEEDRDRMLAEGCDDVVRKPFRREEIHDMLQKHLGVHFLCEQEMVPAPAAPPTGVQEALTPAALAVLPARWARDLEQAALRADLSRILALGEEIRAQHGHLANALLAVANDFDYRRILTWIRGQKEQDAQ
ncbi:MAG: PAS domain S-box protein, partial [Chloroflexi bacterium]|nr:PAS domain S-box protein [Chloroflexota bacterium]